MFDVTRIILYVIFFIFMYYTNFWLITYVEESNTKKSTKRKEIAEWPGISIVIPMYNEEENIGPTIDNICDVDYPKDKLKIIVVDDGSKDNSFKFAQEAIERNKIKFPDLKLILLRQKNQGKYAAVNHGLKYADTPFFATLDADSYPEKDALKKLISEFIDESDDLASVTPILKVYEPKTLVQKIQWLEYAITHFYKAILSLRNAIHVTPGPLAMYRTEIIKKLGGFRHGHKTEDMELAIRLQKYHYRIKQCDNAHVFTKVPRTWRALLKQRIRWYLGNLRNVFDYKEMLFNKEYQDFGLFQFVMIPLSGILAIALIILLPFSMRESIKARYLWLKAYNFNVIEFIMDSFKNFNLDFWFLNLNLTTVVITSLSLIIMFYALHKGLKIFNQKLNLKKGDFLVLLVYIFAYFYFIELVWLIVFKDFIFKKEIVWK